MSTAPFDREAMERCFYAMNAAVAGEAAIDGYAAISTLIAGLASCAAKDKREARRIIDAITNDALAQMRRDFDFFRSTAQHVGKAGST